MEKSIFQLPDISKSAGADPRDKCANSEPYFIVSMYFQDFWDDLFIDRSLCRLFVSQIIIDYFDWRFVISSIVFGQVYARMAFVYGDSVFLRPLMILLHLFLSQVTHFVINSRNITFKPRFKL